MTIDDRVTLTDGRVVSGSVESHDGGVLVRRSDGRRIAYSPLGTQSGTQLGTQLGTSTNAKAAMHVEYGLRSALSRSRPEYLLCAVAAFLGVAWLQGRRLRLMLGVHEIAISHGDALRVSFAGNFLNFAVPFGSTAGDVYKAYHVATRTDQKAEAATTVFVDRLVGLGTLVLVVSLVVMFSPTGSVLASLRPYMAVLLCGGLVGMLAYDAEMIRNTRLVSRLAAWVPIPDSLRRVDGAICELLRRRGVLAMATLQTAILQVLAALAFVFVAMAVRMKVGWGDLPEYFAFFSTGELIKALPGPPQGLGTMELAYHYFFGAFGSASQIVFAAMGIRLVTLLCAMPGLWFVMRRDAETSAECPVEGAVEGVQVQLVAAVVGQSVVDESGTTR
jgi:uncharacterized protein (TIRG00374 family)